MYVKDTNSGKYHTLATYICSVIMLSDDQRLLWNWIREPHLSGVSARLYG